MNQKYTFEDWVNDDAGILTEEVPKDTHRYFWFHAAGRLETEDYYKILDAQAETYKKMVAYELAWIKSEFISTLKRIEAPTPQRIQHVKDLRLRQLESIKSLPQYSRVEAPTPTIGSAPYGARFIIGSYYREYLPYSEADLQKPVGKLLFPSSEAHIINIPTPGIFRLDRMQPGQIDYILIDAKIRFRDWLESGEHLTSLQQEPPLHLSDLMSEKHFTAIMNLLVDSGKCEPKTFVWKDSGKGSKGVLIGLIKHLHLKKYLQKAPTNKQCVEIAFNTFGIEVSFDTAKDIKADTFAEFDFIPPNT